MPGLRQEIVGLVFLSFQMGCAWSDTCKNTKMRSSSNVVNVIGVEILELKISRLAS